MTSADSHKARTREATTRLPTSLKMFSICYTTKFYDIFVPVFVRTDSFSLAEFLANSQTVFLP